MQERHVVIAGDCRPVVSYAAGCGRLSSRVAHVCVDSAMTTALARGWDIEWRVVPKSENWDAHETAAAGRRSGRAVTW
eukprot:5903347-Alexandrium_andersonii.AAC.1